MLKIMSKKKYNEMLEENKQLASQLDWNREQLAKETKKNERLRAENEKLETDLAKAQDKHRKYVQKRKSGTIHAQKKWLNGFYGEDFGGGKQ